MPNLDANTVAQQWASRLGASGDRIKAGVASVTVAPGQAAARQKSAYTSGVANSADKWARRVSAVSLSDWQTSMTTKGVDRIASGATAAVPKMTAFLQKFLPAVQAARASLPARGSYEQNKARATAMMDALHKFQA